MGSGTEVSGTAMNVEGEEQKTITVHMSITGINKERKKERENEGELMKKKKERNKERKKERKKE